MYRKYFAFIFFVLIINARFNSQILKTDSVLLQNKISFKKLLHNNDFLQLQNHFRSYNLLEGAKIISTLEGKLPKNSLEYGYLTYYKGFLYVFLDLQNDFHKEVEKLKNILSTINNLDDKIILTSYYNILKIYEVENAGELDKMYSISKEIYLDVDKMTDKNQFYYFLKGKAARNLAETSITKKKLDDAKNYIEISKKHYDIFNDNYLKAAYYRTKGYINMEETPKKPDSAFNHYLTMLNYAYKSKATFEAYNIYPMISVAAMEIDEPKESAKYLLKYKITNDTIQKNNAEVLNYIRKQKDVKSSEDKKYNFLFAALAIILSGTLIYFFTRKRYKNLPPPKILNLENKDQKDALKKSEIVHLISLSKENENAFYVKFTEDFPILYHKLCNFVPKISESEIKFCMYLKMKYSTKEIAQYTNSTIKSVESKKYRLRKKLNIGPEEDLYAFINNLS